MNKVFRKSYSNIARVLFIPLLITAITGIVLGLGDRFGTLPTVVDNVFTVIHQGEFLGRKLVPFYVLLMGLGVFVIGLITLIDSRDNLISRRTRRNTIGIYKMLALVLVFPLAICVETGVAYRLGTDWLKMPPQQTGIFLSLHTGATFGLLLGIFYTLVTGLSLIVLSFTGIEVTSFRKTRSSKKSRPSSTQVNQSSQSTLSLEDNAVMLRKKIQNAIIIFSLISIAILWFATSAILLSIVIVAIAFSIPAWIIAGLVLKDWQRQQQKIKNRLQNKENDSATILRAIPDSMLRMTQEGICLSYIPAKDASPFVINGEIINKHVIEFLAPGIATQFVKAARIALESGKTYFYRFPISLDNGEQRYHEARISAIGATEVLIMIREITDFDLDVAEREQQLEIPQNNLVRLLDESELVEILETTFEKTQQNDQHHILCCLVVDDWQFKNDRNSEVDFEQLYSRISNTLMYQVAEKMESYLSSNYIAFDGANELLALVLDCSLDPSASVNELRHDLENFIFQWKEYEYSIDVSVSLVKINADSHDITKLIKYAREACNMAKQKIEVQNFG